MASSRTMVEPAGDIEQHKPLLHNTDGRPDDDKDEDQSYYREVATGMTFKSAAKLANLLPTGTVLTFQLLAPIVSNAGSCDDVCRVMTAVLVTLCGLSCFVLSFSDSFKDNQGVVRYGLATCRGLWVIDGTAELPPGLARRYRLKFIDFLHGFMSVMVFAAIALFDKNVVSCFYPVPTDEQREVLVALPVSIGVICSMLFVAFPTTRHGIGFPIDPLSGHWQSMILFS